MADNQTRLTIELEVLMRNLQRRLRELDQLKRKLEAVANVRVGQRTSTAAVDRQAVAAQRLALQHQRLQATQQRLNVQTQELANRQERARQTTDRLAASSQRLNQSFGNQGRVLQQAQRQLNSLGAAALRVGGGLRSVGASAAILVTGPLVALGTIAGRSAADIDAIRNRLIATEGSLEAANARLAQVRKLADESVGVTRRSATDTFTILSTLGEVTEETINKQIRAFGRLNAAFTIDDQQTFFRNLIQIFQQGFEIKDIKEALGRVPLFNVLLESAFGTADPERLRELKAAGKLTLDTFLGGLATAVETDPVLGNIGESIRVRFQKTFERLTDALEPLGRAILGPLERIIAVAEPIILRLSAAFERLPPGVQTAIVAVGLLTAALGPVLFIFGGIASGVGALATALAALAPIITAIGFPAIAAILGGLVIVIAEVTAVVVAFGIAWRNNFLGIQQLTARAAAAVVAAFNRIRTIVEETVQRVLPSLQSITAKVLGGVTGLWNRYGKSIVEIVTLAFQLVTGIIETFFRATGNLIDLIVKLIDGDWRGAWQAFARIVVGVASSIDPALRRLFRIVQRALSLLVAFVRAQAVRFARAAAELGRRFTVSLAGEIILGAPRLREALFLALVTAVAGVNVSGIARLLLSRLVTALKQAAAEGEPTVGVDVGSLPQVGVDVGGKRRIRKPPPPSTDTDEKGAKRLRDLLDKLQEARDRLQETREAGQLEQLRSRIETQFDATRAGLERELKTLEDNYDDRLVALKAYFEQRQSLEESQIDAEIQKELELTSVLFSELSARRRAAESEFRTELQEIERDPKLKGQARETAIQTAELRKANEIQKALTEFGIRHEESTARVTELEKQRGAIASAILRLSRLTTEELTKQQDQLRFDLLEEQGRTADAAAGRLRAQFTETLRDLRIDTSGLGADLQTALTNVDLSVLRDRLNELPEPIRVLIDLLDIGIKRAQIAEQTTLVDNLSAQLRLEEERIQNRVLDGLISQRDAHAEIVAKQREYKALLLDILAGELAKARAIGDQGLIVSLEAQVAEVERLGQALDTVGQQLNQQLFSDLQSGISGIFSGARRGFEGLRDAAISFGERLLDSLNDLAATSIVKRLEGLFKPDATDTTGTIGGFFSKLFGLQPKQQISAATASATLQTGAATATATLTTGVAAAATTFGTSVITAATSFASLILSAGAAFAASVAAGQAAGAVGGGLGAAISGAAATGLFPAVPGGVYKFIEGGHPEAVLTTDPRHAARQVQILKALLRETRGFGGRIRGFAEGAFISPHEAQSLVLGGLGGSIAPASGSVGEFAIAGTPSMMRLRQVLVDQRNVGDWINSSEGEQVLVDFLYRKAPVIRNIGGKK